ncbi:MAG: hypothetical protein D6805_08840 [Planctomycetota bacterium]|nr:MAG: hypothetical protein D6805_08840 [Planctomycetota bacterium]
MFMYRLEISYRIVFQTPLHIGSGKGGSLIDRKVLKDRDGRPFLPGSTIKGCCRYAAERLAATLGFENIADPHQDWPLERLYIAPSPYLIDRLFGSKSQGDRLYFSNATPEEEEIEYEVITRNMYDRVARTAIAGHLYSTEQVPPLAFRGRILAIHPKEHLYPAYDDGLDKIALAREPWPFEYSLLLASLLALERMGGGKSHGLGRLNVDRDQLSIQFQGEKVESSELSPLLKALKMAQFEPEKRAEDNLKELKELD